MDREYNEFEGGNLGIDERRKGLEFEHNEQRE